MNARSRKIVVAFLALMAMVGAILAVLTSVHFGH
jgi:hypothetical protein